MPEIDFTRIRPLKDGEIEGFEELTKTTGISCASFSTMSAMGPGCVKTIFGRFKRNIHPFIEILQSIKSMT